MLYFSSMEADHELWSDWVIVLREKGLSDLTAWLIRAGEPLTIIVSQMITMSMPFVFSQKANNELRSIITILEDREQLRAFSEALQSDGGRDD
ncbi:MAG: hypothetical protein JXR32_05700 [Anaerolineaceae bacterium]|nr:hypothetical protein [Anaerolineaceae bacterium]